MKFKTTKKAMQNNYNKIVSIGYCNAQYLLQYENAIAYSTRAEGWACDYYDVNGVLISTGYAPLSSKNTNSNYDMVHNYDNRARAIVYNNDLDYETRKEQVSTLLAEFIKEVTQ